MLGLPPKPTAIVPYEESFNPYEWIIQPKYRGWRVVVHHNEVFTRHGNRLPIRPDYPEVPFEYQPLEYQIDGEIVNPERLTEYGVRTAIKQGIWRIEPIDIYLPAQPNMFLSDRLNFMEEVLGIPVTSFGLMEYEDIFRYNRTFQDMGWEGAVIKRKDSIYKISNLISIIDSNWFKVK